MSIFDYSCLYLQQYPSCLQSLFRNASWFLPVWRVHENTESFCSTVCQSQLWKKQFGTWSLKLSFRKQEAPGKWRATRRDSVKTKVPHRTSVSQGWSSDLGQIFTLLGADWHNASAILAKGYHQCTCFLLHPGFRSSSWVQLCVIVTLAKLTRC